MQSTNPAIRIMASDPQPLPSNDDSFNIMVTGITGSGKTTLISGITGVEGNQTNYGGIAKVDTTEVAPSTCTLQRDITATFWDTPGLQGGSEMRRIGLSQMKEKCPQPDVIIFCIKCVDTRFVVGSENPNVRAMKTLTKHFGKTFWKDAIVTLTFANSFEHHRLNWRGQDTEQKQESFKKEMEEWQECVKYCLSTVGVPQKIVETVTIIPVGYSTDPMLLNGDNWVPKLKALCVNRLHNRTKIPEGGNTKFTSNELLVRQRGLWSVD